MMKICEGCIHFNVCKYADKIEEPKSAEPFETKCKYYLFNYNLTSASTNGQTIFNQINASKQEKSCSEPCGKLDCFFNLNGRCRAEIAIQQECIYGNKEKK